MSAETDAALLFMADKLTALGLQENADVLRALLSERDALRAELERIKAAPVVVPEFPTAEQVRRVGYTMPGTKAVQDFYTGWRCCYEIASRLRTVQPGEVEDLRDIVHYVAYPEARSSSHVPFGGDEQEWALSLCRKHGIALPTTTEKEADHGR